MDIISQNAQLNTPLNNNIQNTPELKRYPSNNNKMVIRPCTLWHCLVFDIMLVAIVGFIVCLKMDSIAQAFIFLSAGIVISLLILICLFSRTEIIKDIPNKKIIFYKANIYGCRKNKFELNEKVHFHSTVHYRDTEDGSIKDVYFYAINDFKDVTLDLNTIKQKPLDLFHFYKYWEYATNLNELNQFVGSPANYDNPLTFDIKKYMKKNQIESNPFYTFESNNYGLSRIMKFSEQFFTYYIRFPYEDKNKETDMNLTRIDFVFSENYDEIFIGIVKSNKKSYKNTFHYEMNLINKFMINMKQTNEIDLLVVLKNNPKAQYICSIKNILKINADGLIYLLNEKLNLKNENTNSNNNFNNNNNGITPY
jgi:hypothetical protein